MIALRHIIGYIVGYKMSNTVIREMLQVYVRESLNRLIAQKLWYDPFCNK